MKTVWRPLLLDFYEAGATERWLEDLAARGLVAAHIGWGAQFRRGAPEPERRYRAELDEKSLLDADPLEDAGRDEKTALFGELGWDYVGSSGGYRFYTSDDPAAPETHTDPALAALAFRKRERAARRGFWIVLAAALGLLAVFALFLSHTAQPALWLCGRGGAFAAQLAISFVFLLGALAVGWRRDTRLRRRVEAGAETAKDYRRVRRRVARGGIEVAALLLALLAIQFLPRMARPTPPLSALGIESLAELVDDPAFQLASNEGVGYYDLGQWSPFAPWQHEILQWGAWPDGREATLRTRAYRTLPPALAKAVYAELSDEAAQAATARTEQEDGQITYVTEAGWTRVALKDGTAIYTEYREDAEKEGP